jgi:hypothetical protein
VDIARRVQIAMLGEVPPTLRFVYVSYIEGKLNFHAVLTDDATEDHLESVSGVLSEVGAGCPLNTVFNESIVKDSKVPWKIDNGENLMYLRYGELSDV